MPDLTPSVQGWGAGPKAKFYETWEYERLVEA